MAAEIHLPFVLGESGDGGAGTYTAYILDVSRNKRLDAVLDDIEQNAHSYTGGDGVNVSSGYVISLTTATASKIGGVKLGATASDTNRPVSVDSNGNAQVAMQEADATHKGVARLTTTATASADAQSDATAITPKAVAAMISSAGGNYVAGTGIDITNDTISVSAAYAGKIDKIGDVSGYGANETIAGKIATLEGITYTGGDGVNVSSGYVISLTTATASKIGGVKLGATASDTNRPVSVDSNGNAQVAMQEADGTHKGVAQLSTGATILSDAQSDAKAVTPNALATFFGSRIWIGTQAQYDAIVTKDANTLYYIKET